jgi:hypothetical protein
MSIVKSSETYIEINAPVIPWNHPSGLNFHPYNNYVKRNVSHEQLQPLIKQIAIHWAANYKASHMFYGLNSRKLSCNFMIDDDNVDGYATIYQNLDCQHSGWSQGPGLNALGLGIEIAYMPDLWVTDRYSEALRRRFGVPLHESTETVVHGKKLKVFLPTQAQMNSLTELVYGLLMLFPEIPWQFPRDKSGNIITTTIEKPQEFSGLVQHYHVNRDKIDAAGIDMAAFENALLHKRSIGITGRKFFL